MGLAQIFKDKMQPQGHGQGRAACIIVNIAQIEAIQTRNKNHVQPHESIHPQEDLDHDMGLFPTLLFLIHSLILVFPSIHRLQTTA